MSAYSDLKALIQQAPEASDYSIWRFWNAGSASDNTRYIVLIENGGRTDEDIRRATFNVYFVSRIQDSDLQGFNDDIDEISKFLAKNFKEGCVVGVNVVASASGSRPNTDGRFWSTMDLQILYSLADQ